MNIKQRIDEIFTSPDNLFESVNIELTEDNIMSFDDIHGYVAKNHPELSEIDADIMAIDMISEGIISRAGKVGAIVYGATGAIAGLASAGAAGGLVAAGGAAGVGAAIAAGGALAGLLGGIGLGYLIGASFGVLIKWLTGAEKQKDKIEKVTIPNVKKTLANAESPKTKKKAKAKLDKVLKRQKKLDKQIAAVKKLAAAKKAKAAKKK